jgi:D-galactarolactone cycloisomerase
VWRLLGGYRESLPIISIAGYYEEGKKASAYAREMEWLKSVGMAGCKFKVGGLAPEQDAERVRAARDGAGPNFILAVDANRGWNTTDAIRFAHLVEDLGIVWFEEPCHWYDDAYMMARVRQATRIPVNAGQSEMTSHGVRRLIDAQAVDYVNFDASEAGGITEWRRAAAMCAVHGVKMAHHEEPQLALHMLAAVPHGTYLECFADPDRDPAWQHLWANRPPIRDGRVTVPDEPGFGLVLDPGVIAKYRID